MGVGRSHFADYTLLSEEILEVCVDVFSTITASEPEDLGTVLPICSGNKVFYDRRIGLL